MTQVEIISGFLGAGKTTLIKKLLEGVFAREQLVLIENEFGEIGIDGGFLKEAGIQIREMNSGCICCSLVGDFAEALKKCVDQYHPDRIVIEPSGVGKLSDVIRAVQGVQEEAGLQLHSFTTVVDATKCRMYMKNFGEFFDDQVAHANTLILSRTQKLNARQLNECLALLRQKNPSAMIVTTPWDQLTSSQIYQAMEQRELLQKVLELNEKEDAEDELHTHAHSHDHHEACECESKAGGDHDGHDDLHQAQDGCACGHHHHHHHHHHGHDADEIFTSWGVQTAHVYSEQELRQALKQIADSDALGTVLRAKGIVPCDDGSWLHFDMVPQETEIRHGAPAVTGMLCVIGSELKQQELAALFHIGE